MTLHHVFYQKSLTMTSFYLRVLKSKKEQMKVTYTPTNKKQIEEYLGKGDPTLLNPTVSIEHPMDDMTLPDFMTQVIFPMLAGLGYTEGAIARTITINEEAEDLTDY